MHMHHWDCKIKRYRKLKNAALLVTLFTFINLGDTSIQSVSLIHILSILGFKPKTLCINSTTLYHLCFKNMKKQETFISV